MNREQLLRALRHYARKHQLAFDVDTKRGKGSHYWIQIGDAETVIQHDVNPKRIRTILKQLKIDPADL